MDFSSNKQLLAVTLNGRVQSKDEGGDVGGICFKHLNGNVFSYMICAMVAISVWQERVPFMLLTYS